MKKLNQINNRVDYQGFIFIVKVVRNRLKGFNNYVLLMLLILTSFSVVLADESTNDLSTASTKRIFTTVPGQKLIERANKFYNQQQYAKAMLLYRKAEKRGVNPVVTSFNSGNCYFRLEKLPQAAASFKKAIRLSKEEYPSALFNLAAVLYRLKQYSESIAVYHRALKSDPENSSAWLYLAEAYQRTGDVVGMQKALESALELNPDDVSIIYQLAEVHVSMSEIERAVSLVRMAYIKNPEEVDFLIYIGDLYRVNKEYTLAASSYREALTLDSENIDLMYKIADVLALDKQIFLAMDYLNKALLIKPDFEDALIFLGNLFFDAKWWDRAEISYRKAVALGNTEGTQGLKNIAWEMERIGDRTQAIKMFKELLIQNPNDLEIKQEISRIETAL